MVPTVAKGVIFDHELRGERRTGIQRKRGRAIELLVTKSSDRIGSSLAVPDQ